MPSGIWHANSGPEAAPRIVMVHGTLDRSAGMLRLSRRLTDEFRVSRYDRRGYGRSALVGPPFDMESQVGDLLSLIELDGSPPVVLFGHSFGGNVALAAAAQRPDLVAGVILYESPLSWREWWPSLPASEQAKWDAAPEDSAERLLRSLVTDAVWDKLPAQTRADRRAEGTAMVAELASLRSGAPWTADQITCPVLALAGEHGLERHREAMVVVARECAGEFIEIPGAGHFGPNTQSGRVAATVAPFVRRCIG